ncbi:hypothetical protein RhiirA1_451204 [Rhizophagus irregularis]|uniref:Uncharacterized protein n=1 Tax=Rhizophagus irregularis TaxID=588596 RepID=A0A2N0SCX5_9GLOM|nr:hypothetical protein RhiirA1_451204 [Rhizophagus irregularis]
MEVASDLDYTKDLKIEVDSDSDHTKEDDPDPTEELKELKELPEEILMSILKKVNEFTKDSLKNKALKEEYTKLKS